jgi:hypothetical protein
MLIAVGGMKLRAGVFIRQNNAHDRFRWIRICIRFVRIEIRAEEVLE